MEKFTEQITALSKRVGQMKDSIATEEATKTSIIMPFFQMLGYDIFNPSEFVPEFTADIGIKKGEKVDYAVILEGAPVILIEAKSINESLQKHDSQLFRYFGTSTARFGILTNGIVYRFYTDLEEQNKMDSTPFFEFNILDLKDNHLHELAKFRKEYFDIEKISSTASELKYLNKLKKYLQEQWEDPSEAFVKFFVGEIYEGSRTKTALEKFHPIIKNTFKQFINERVSEKLNAALHSTTGQLTNEMLVDGEVNDQLEPVTTEEELEGYTIVKVILNELIEPERLSYRDNKSYFNILLDDTIRKWIVRINVETSSKWIQFNDDEKAIVKIDKVTDLIKYADKITEVANKFLLVTVPE